MSTGLNGFRHVVYRGHEITVERKKTLGGDSGLFFSVFRVSDQFECDSGFQYDGNSLKLMAHLQARIDEELEKPEPWKDE